MVMTRDGKCSCAGAAPQAANTIVSANADSLMNVTARSSAVAFSAVVVGSRRLSSGRAKAGPVGAPVEDAGPWTGHVSATARTGEASAPMMLSGSAMSVNRSLVMRSRFFRYGMVTIPCSLSVREL